MAAVHPSRLGLIPKDLRPEEDAVAERRRASPEYDDYSKSRPPPPQRMYPERGGGGRYGGGGHFEGNADWLDRCRDCCLS